MLTINPSEIILTIVNFFILFFLLKKFLYSPIIAFMDERKKGIDEKMEMERQALEALDEKDRSLELLRSESAEQARRMLECAKMEGEKQAQMLLQESRDMTAVNRKKAAGSAGMISERETRHLDSNMDRLARLLADSLLSEKAS